jgi:hypothetical protein
LDGIAAYSSSSGPLPDSPEGYLVLWLTIQKQYDATLELNAAMNMIYLGDTVIYCCQINDCRRRWDENLYRHIAIYQNENKIVF